MTDKAYIVANEQQEREVLEKLEREGYCWINDQGKPISSGVLIARELEDYPLFIGERFETKTIYWQDLSKLVNEEIIYDGRKEEHMSEKYVVSQEFMNELEENVAQGGFVSVEVIEDLPYLINNWRISRENNESNNRLIAIIRWLNGEDVFEVEKPKKWVVRSKEPQGSVDGEPLYIWFVDELTLETETEATMPPYIRRFNTKEEAQSWANAHQEVIEVEI